MDGDWICLHRKVLRSAVFSDSNAFRLFAYCMLRARWKDTTYKGRPIERGQFAATMRDIQDDMGLSRQELRTAFDKLTTWEAVRMDNVTNRFHIITVCKYRTYQDLVEAEQPTDNQPITNQQPTSNQPTTNQQPTQESNKGNKGNKGTPLEGETKKRARFAPPTLDEVTAYCQDRGNTVDPEAWMAYYESNGWRVGRNPMKSWKMAVVTWEKRNKEYSKGNGRKVGEHDKDPRGNVANAKDYMEGLIHGDN